MRYFLRTFVAYVLCISACSAFNMKVLELRDVQNFSVSETLRDGSLSLRVSGLAFHSALAVERIETTRDKEDLTVKVILVPARKGLSGRFDYTIDVPSGVRRVLFGESGDQIWPAESQRSQ